MEKCSMSSLGFVALEILDLRGHNPFFSGGDGFTNLLAFSLLLRRNDIPEDIRRCH